MKLNIDLSLCASIVISKNYFKKLFDDTEQNIRLPTCWIYSSLADCSLSPVTADVVAAYRPSHCIAYTVCTMVYKGHHTAWPVGTLHTVGYKGLLCVGQYCLYCLYCSASVLMSDVTGEGTEREEKARANRL